MRGRTGSANRIFFGLTRHRRRLRLQALPARGARGHPVESEGAFFSAELLIKLRAAGPHASSRSACRTTRARPARRPAPSRRSSSAPCATSGACGCACGSNRGRALRRGGPIVGDAPTEPAGPEPVSSRGPPAPGRRRASSRSRGTRRAAGRRPASPVDSIGSPSSSTPSPPSAPSPARSRTDGTAKIGAPTRTASASASDGRASISPTLPSRSTNRRAW